MTEGEDRLQERRDKEEAVYKRLLPCPFCGGSVFRVEENGTMWTGMGSSPPVSISIRHWCQNETGPSRPIERVGRDYEAAVAAWNRRDPPQGTVWPPPKATQDPAPLGGY